MASHVMSSAVFILTVFSACYGVNAESHTIKFDNQCGYGTPQLIKGNDILTTTSYTHDGVFSSAIAYLQTGHCLFNGEGCTIVEMSLQNPTCAGCGSSSDISLIPPLAFSVPTTFSYYGGCDGTGATCSHANCDTAFFVPDDTFVQVACQTDNVNLLITFCGGNDTASSSASIEKSTSSTSSSKVIATKLAVASMSAVLKVDTPSSTSSASSSTSSSTSPSESNVVGAPSNRKSCKSKRSSLPRNAEAEHLRARDLHARRRRAHAH